MPDNQWNLVQQSLQAHGNGSDTSKIPTNVIVEAGFLVSLPDRLSPLFLQGVVFVIRNLSRSFGGCPEQDL
jgi:hypothetical protein